MARRIAIYYDSKQEGNWFKGLSHSLRKAPLKKLEGGGGNPPRVERLLRYDRPDIIVAVDGKPKLVVEKTREVPTGHNVTQRFARLANAVEEGVMVIYFLPYRAMKHGKHASRCYISARLFMALERMEAIHRVPALAVEWPSTRHFELKRGGDENEEMRELVADLASSRFDFRGLGSIRATKRKMHHEREERTERAPATARPPRSVKVLDTREFIKALSGRVATFRRGMLPRGFLKRRKTLVYRLGMTPAKCRREDPYTGTQFLYDYIWCRKGSRPSEKHTNLVLDVPRVSKVRWLQANPNSPVKKSSLYYATANLIALKDGLIVCKNKLG